jgi:ribonuclease HI
MGKKSKKYYAVVNGRRPGIYTTWLGKDGAAEQVKNFPGAFYKGFYTREDAIVWLRENSQEIPYNPASELLKVEGGRGLSEGFESPEDVLKAGKVLIYTDGGAISNPGPGGYGIVLRYKGRTKELSGGFRGTTNNRMEIMACIEALRALKQKSSVVIYSDSKYVVDSISEGWARRWQANGWMRNREHKAENVDLWQQLLDLCSRHEVEFRWIRGHVGEKDNERCDQLAMEAARQKDLSADVGYENRQ